MKDNRLRRIFRYGSVSKEEYDLIRPLVWSRNKRILRITSLLSAGMGAVFLAYSLASRSGTWLPYLILFLGSGAIYLLNRIAGRTAGERFAMAMCYGQMALVCVYAGFLSVQPSNFAIPATSVVVFIALLPMSIDDRPARMYVFMLVESCAYLSVSYLFKDRAAFRLDVMNVATFCAVGMVLYAFICARNIREISQGVRIEKIQRSVISSLAAVVEERDENTGGHINRTGEYVRALIERMKRSDKYSSLPDSYFNNVLLATAMHDVGKIKIPDAILNKPGKLTDVEYEIIKTHPEQGAKIIKRTMKDVEDEDYFDVACNIARSHHERYDGQGYPDGLSGGDIPLEARIMALADVYDALVSERPYKKAFSRGEALRIIREGSGTQFDPDLTELFLEANKE